MTRTQFLESIETWNVDDIHAKYVYDSNQIELTYHDRTAEYRGDKNDVALIATLVNALDWRKYLRFSEV